MPRLTKGEKVAIFLVEQIWNELEEQGVELFRGKNYDPYTFPIENWATSTLPAYYSNLKVPEGVRDKAKIAARNLWDKKLKEKYGENS